MGQLIPKKKRFLLKRETSEGKVEQIRRQITKEYYKEKKNEKEEKNN